MATALSVSRSSLTSSNLNSRIGNLESSLKSSRRCCRSTRWIAAFSRGLKTESTGTCLQSLRSVNMSRRRSWALVPLAGLNITELSKWDALPSPSSPGSSEERNTKGWTDRQGRENTRLVAQLRNIAVAALDRSEIHAIAGVQRDNWNKLCLSTVNGATIAAAVLAAIGGATPALSLSVTAFLLNVCAGGLIFMANKFQPSQLAEQQRTAGHIYTNLAKEIEAILFIDPRLREEAHIYVENKLATLQYLNIAFPLSLQHNDTEISSTLTEPSVQVLQTDHSEQEMPANNSNGWSKEITEDLKQISKLLKIADIGFYMGLASKKETEKSRFVALSSRLVVAAALLNIAQYSLPHAMNVLTSGLAAACSVAAMFCFSFLHGGQIGMIFQMYQNCIGAYAGMDHTIQTTIRVPVCQREDGELFHQKIALQLGRRPNELPLIHPGDKSAGKAF